MLTQRAHNGIEFVVKGQQNVDRFIRSGRDHVKKCHLAAVKVEAFRLTRQLKKEIRQGSPGGRRLQPLSYISRRLDRVIKTGGGTTRRQSPNRAPLARLAMGVRYNASSPDRIKVGWVTPPGRPDGWQQGTWRYLAKKQQTGFTADIPEPLRERILRRGGRLGKIEGGNTPFFLKRKTTRFKTPPRPIMEPFWRAERRRAAANISRNFKLKLKGHRI